MSELKEQVLQLQNNESMKNKIAELKIVEAQYNEKLKELHELGVEFNVKSGDTYSNFFVETRGFNIRIKV